MKRIGIFGTSGMAREAGDIAYDMDYKPVYIAYNQADYDAWIYSDEIIMESDVLRYTDMHFVVGIGDNRVRLQVVQRYNSQLKFINLIHSSVTFGRLQRSIIDERSGLIVLAGARFTNNIQIGSFCIINQNATIAHDVIIGSYVHIAPGAIISGNVHIGDGCWVGAGAVVNQGSDIHKLQIGNHTIIGSGAVVLRACDPNSIYAGVPARKIK
jgi:sugar O-acyltransferase (sialic acid O-acetyltransferase NeuD family)